MNPQHSSLSGQVFSSGTTAQAYMCMECDLIHIYAIDYRLSNVTLRGALSLHAGGISFFRYSLQCLDAWLCHYANHLFWLWHKFACIHGSHACFLYSLDPPGDPPWYKFTNYLNTKNRSFLNPSSWTIPVTWRSLERT
jgi:hypothetical protein